MRLSSGLNYTAATGTVMLLLSGCATGPRLQAAKPPPAATARTLNPAVKIGQPYLVLGKWYYPKDDRDYDVTGVASWYGPGFHGLSTANGEPYDQDGITAAHKTLPLPCFVEVTNLENGRTLTVRINDRGPFVGERIIDLSRRSAQLLGIDRAGTAKVRVRRVFPERAEVAALAPPPPAPLPLAEAVPATVPVVVVALPPSGIVPAGNTFVQVAALSDQGRAEWLRGFLKPYGSTVVERAAAGLWRVRLGPYADRASATPILAQVQAAGYTGAQIVTAQNVVVKPSGS